MVRLLVQKGPVVKGAIKSSTTRSSVRSSWIVSEQDTVNRDSETISPGLNYKFVNPYWDSPVRIIFNLHSKPEPTDVSSHRLYLYTRKLLRF